MKNRKNTKKIAAALTAAMLAFILMIGGVFAEEEKTAATELEQFIADWGESYAGAMSAKDYTLDFNSFETGTDFSMIEEIMEDWIANNATGEYITKIAESGGEKYLAFAPFAQMYTAEGITDKYVFSVDLKGPESHGFGIFFRTSGETNINPYFEDDKSGQGIFGIGPNGVCLIPSGKSLKIFVKYYDEKKSADKEMKYINNKTVTVKVNANFNNEFATVSVADYGAGAKIFVNGELVATLEFSELIDSYDEYLSEYKYYSKVAVYDNTGKRKAEVKNALICADTSVLALGMRINEGYADNIVISEYPEAITSVALSGTPKTSYFVGDNFDAAGAAITVTYESGRTKRVALNANMLEGFDTSAEGNKTVTVKYMEQELTFDITVARPPEPTEAPKATDAPEKTAENGAAPATGEKSNEGGEQDEKKNNKPLIIGLIIGGVLLAAIAVTAILLKIKTGKKGADRK
ncbi:MAG: bacterial Ig-like domain-containing protein [Clostridia bacterium]|nr:bacterial Ig-like domain-containing protein [Clostridia bacterium]